jgi:hypothetical protein
MAEAGGILWTDIRECEHALAVRHKGGHPSMANSLINLGANAEGEIVVLHVCVECWQQIVGLVLAEIVESAIRREVRKYGLTSLAGGNDGS